MDYYNEIDEYCAQWLRNLIAAGVLNPGVVDTRSIEDVTPNDLRGFNQCHFFAGLGVWPYALKQQGLGDKRGIWTGSCPCQPFSAAGKAGGFADERHLWPAFFHLISVCRPGVVLGEQVASKDGLAWLDLVSSDMQAAGYTFAANDLCGAGFGAPHIRQRSFFVGSEHSSGAGLEGYAWDGDCAARWPDADRSVAAASDASGLADSACGRRGESSADSGGRGSGDRAEGRSAGLVPSGAVVGLGDASDESRERDAGSVFAAEDKQHGSGLGVDGCLPVRPEYAGEGMGEGLPGPTNGFWRDADWLFCRDGKWRPVEPGAQPLVDGAPSRVGRLRAYGNAIIAPVAEEFVGAVRRYIETIESGI